MCNHLFNWQKDPVNSFVLDGISSSVTQFSIPISPILDRKLETDEPDLAVLFAGESFWRTLNKTYI